MISLSSSRGSGNDPTSVRYFQTFFGYQLRPDAQMPIEAHQECGRLLKRVAVATEGQGGAHGLVTYVRGTLDDWAMREYDASELDFEVLGALYCPGPQIRAGGQTGSEDLINMLMAVEAILIRHYPDGRALRKLLRLIKQAIASLAK